MEVESLKRQIDTVKREIAKREVEPLNGWALLNSKGDWQEAVDAESERLRDWVDEMREVLATLESLLTDS
jgi:hypothetical protein